MNKLRLAILFAAVLAALTLSCGGVQRDFSALELTLTQDPTSLDPAMIVDVAGGSVAAKLFNGLVRFDGQMNVVSDIASAWKIADDGRTYVLSLRRDVRFHNGRRVTAHDIKYSFERVLSPDSGSRRKWLFEPVLGARNFMEGRADSVAGIRVIDDFTVKITLERPLAVFLGFLAMPNAYIVPQEEVEHWGKDFSDHAVGTGPFVLAEWKHDDLIRLRRNEDYFGERARVESVNYRVLPEEFTRVAEFEAGNLDIIEVPTAEFARLASDPMWRGHMKSRIGLNTYYLGFNCRRPPMDNPAFRRAVNMAIDRQKIVDVVLQRRARLAAGPIPPELPGHNPELAGYPYEPETARQMLESLGEARHPLKLFQSADRRALEITEAIQYYLEKAGLDVDIVQLEWTAFKQAVNDGEADLFLLSWYADYPDAENFLFPVFHSSNWGASGNRSFYQNPAFDALIERAQREPDVDKRLSLYQEAEAMVFHDAPWAFLWHQTDYFLAQPWVEDYEPVALYNADKGAEVILARPKQAYAGRGGALGWLLLAPIAALLGLGLLHVVTKPALLLFVARRVLLAIPTLIGVALIIFIILKMVPGDPALAMVGERADAATLEQIRRDLGLDEPLPAQFLRYLALIGRGELGRSYYTNRPVAASLIEKFPNTLRLAGAAITVSILLGITLGIISAVKRNTLTDRLVGVVSVLGISTPVFWLALLLVLVFAYRLGWLPPSGMGNGALAYLVLPAIALGTNSAAFIARVTRSSMLEAMSQPFITAARAKGLSRGAVALKHALRNALIPVVTLIGIDMGSYLNGSVLTETIFGWDGIGRYAMTAILKHDYPVILGTVLFGAAVFVIVNLFVDVLYAAIDPRIHVGGQ
ncbi:MAG: ABC transporter permease subunit [Candidatus Abyssobacteria bacterium SURF_17]|uniref:ABC transporter permease subunit n=1 Tax=Candidatus Abyssobacteria bacterium SURF_17 TaxID=2093361 RepID=A0A419EUJ3_9BACT|nr:MAG: ABC transporter permease subunit [Candidatus Abyssubacteria bacterium SURF_17]